MAAQLKKDTSLDVSRTRGRLGELRVVVDGAEVVNSGAMGYPTPGSVVEKVRAHLAGTASAR